MEIYPLVKHVHMAAALLSFLGFTLRGIWMVMESDLLQAKLTRILPHIIDTVLLAAAIYLLVLLQINPLVTFWVAAKLLLLVAYIVIGTIALKRGRTKRTRVIALAVSIATIMAIFALAAVKPVLA